MDSESNLQPMPSAVMAEKAVLSMAIKQLRFMPLCKAEGIDSDSFYHPQNKQMWAALNYYQKQYPDETEVNMGVLIQILNIKSMLEKIGGASYIAEIWVYEPSDGSFSKWCEILREMKAQRMAKTISTKLDECESSEDAIAVARDALESLTKAVCGKSRSRTANEAAKAFLEQFKDNHNNGDIPGVSTGFPEIDQICGGMKAGELWVVCALPSMGKSVLMLQMAYEVLSQGKKVIFYSLEMMESEIIGRLVTLVGRVSHDAITKPRSATKGDFQKIKTAIESIESMSLFIDCSSEQNIYTIMAESESIQDREGEIGLIVADYVQLMREKRVHGQSREEEVAKASSGLKQLAKKMKCPVLTGAQLNDDGKTRESRAIMQDADVLLGIMEEGIKIGKMRNAKRGDILPLYLNGKYQKFTQVRPNIEQ